MEAELCWQRRPPSLADIKAVWGSGGAHVPSIATRRPRPQAVGARGAPHLPFGFASKPSLSAPCAEGLLSVFWERGYPDLPACGPRCGSIDGLVWPIFSTNNSRPSRGAKPRELDDTKTSKRSGLLRMAPKEQRFLSKPRLVRFR